MILGYSKRFITIIVFHLNKALFIFIDFFFSKSYNQIKIECLLINAHYLIKERKNYKKLQEYVINECSTYNMIRGRMKHENWVT